MKIEINIVLEYYVDKAKEIEKMGAHILAIKDMSALLKPYAAKKLINALKNEISIPIHLHTHDTTGNGVATVLMAAMLELILLIQLSTVCQAYKPTSFKFSSSGS